MHRQQSVRSSAARGADLSARRPRQASGWVLAAALGFGLLTLAVVLGFHPLARADAWVSAAAYRAAIDYPAWRTVMYAVTRTANASTLTPIVAAAALLLVWRGRWRQACFVVAAMAATTGVRLVILTGVDRPRPVDQLAPSAGWSFPSGHTTASASAALVAVLVCWQLLAPGRGRAVLAGLAGAWAVAVGVSRVALVVHWPSDVVGAWLLTVVVVPTVGVLLRAVLGPAEALPSVPVSGR
ncbi:phosphatase PAP2 family protein [Micromonospora sp. NPDC092111]|uniref:phosphatase PAP2 family protein n=1 Tax=Micromonospora sp. NPDC092111 TaxID=3364289 RepID=UPI00382D0AFB